MHNTTACHISQHKQPCRICAYNTTQHHTTTQYTQYTQHYTNTEIKVKQKQKVQHVLLLFEDGLLCLMTDVPALHRHTLSLSRSLSPSLFSCFSLSLSVSPLSSDIKYRKSTR